MCVLGISWGTLSAQVAKRYSSYEDYIRKYHKEAIRQMERYAIPASVTMAQGLLETGAGKSSLATEHNNHFGIKCHSTWQGKKTYKTDDAPNECFRVYTSWQDSYEDHSLFLKKPRYARLFTLRSDDYRAWCRGLQTAGYATNKGYANKLIQIIETYELYALDKSQLPLWMQDKQVERKENGKSSSQASPKKIDKPLRPIYMSYGLYYVLADPNDNLKRISQETGVSISRLAMYNDISEDMSFQEGDVIYLERKHRKATEKYSVHTVVIGDSMHSISQRYGIRLESLYELNSKGEDYVPEEGDTLRLR